MSDSQNNTMGVASKRIDTYEQETEQEIVSKYYSKAFLATNEVKNKYSSLSVLTTTDVPPIIMRGGYTGRYPTSSNSKESHCVMNKAFLKLNEC